MPAELRPALWSNEVRALLADHSACFSPQNGAGGADAPRKLQQGPPQGGSVRDAADFGATASDALVETATAAVSTSVAATAAAVVPSALWSQAPLWAAEDGVAQPDEGSAANFPVGLTDVNGQQGASWPAV